MIKLGKLTDYAVVVMMQLTREPHATVRSVHYLSEKTGLPEATIAKILKRLAKSGLVSGVRGISGGYALTRVARSISIGEVIAAMEGPIQIVSCVQGSRQHCRSGRGCQMRGQWDILNEKIRQVFADFSLTDFAKERPTFISFPTFTQSSRHQGEHVDNA